MKTLFFAVVLLSLLYPFGSSVGLDMYSISRVIFGFMLLFYLFSSTTIEDKTLRISLSFTFILIYMSIFTYSSSFINSIFERSSQQTIILILALYIMTISTLKQEDKLLRTHLITASIALLISGISLIVIAIQNETNLYHSIISVYGNIRIYNHIQTVLIPSIIILMALVNNQSVKIILYITLSISFAIVIASGARGTMLATIIFIAISALILNSRERFSLLKSIAISLIVGIVIYSLFETTGSVDNAQHLSEFGSSGRSDIYLSLINFLSENKEGFLVPIGFADKDNMLYSFFHPHNVLVYMFMGGGIVFLIYGIYILFSFTMDQYHKANSGSRRIKVFIFAYIISVLTHSMLSGVYINPIASLWILSLIAIANKGVFRDEVKIQKYISVFILVSISTALYVFMSKSLDESIRLKDGEKRLCPGLYMQYKAK